MPCNLFRQRSVDSRGRRVSKSSYSIFAKKRMKKYALSRPRGLREALLIVASFLMFFFCLITPDVFVPWLAGGALLLLGAGLWGLFRAPAKSSLREIHCLRGTPRRWGLFGENDQEQINNISLGIIDLVYPAHWQPYIAQDLGQQTDIDIYLDRHVVRQGRYLSLHDEVKKLSVTALAAQYDYRCGLAAGAVYAVILDPRWICR
ncbi:membrane protein IgaA [Escherichia coli]|nr:membrane protein IgaA [Escherichia coli]